ncbi:DUF4384 domain-containing protein [Massilia yuzhufengensis]|uniref:Caspase domain-containing protein n=1 Tax=Massilia yuzhufengensis TaxID=1164594 RepID=A0A1I1E9P4_9BURK|nr:DUF4384 domain-containing protein [Massilia yuzhufengensis]SFB83302.1 Caspase domain-containing protein [Massilia yuzhufengensis]
MCSKHRGPGGDRHASVKAMQSPASWRKLIASSLLLASSALFAPVAGAENFALIMTIGSYSNPAAALPGIDLDAASARRIAASMGVDDRNILEYKDAQLTREGMRAGFARLTSRISAGDNVFIYYSGHGTQRSGGAKCLEGMVAHDMASFDDADIEVSLADLASKAGQVVMLNDSCFSGGQATKTVRATPGSRGKAWKSEGSGSGYECGQAINAKFTRNLVPTAARRGANLLYIAAAGDNEVAFASSGGSAATVAWVSCLRSGADADRSGMLTGRELQQCAQDYVRSNGYQQTITLVGNADLPLSFGEGHATGANVDALATLDNLRRQASPASSVELHAPNPRMTIGKDYLDLRVTTGQAGYLYLLHVGSDGKTFDLLYPNARDSDNYVRAGTMSLPRAGWGIQAMGPPGTSHVLAILSDKPRQFDKGMTGSAGTPFKSSNATGAATRNLGVVGMGQGSESPGRMGASQVLAVHEVH